MSLATHVFEGIVPFHLGYQTCSHRIGYNIPLLSFSRLWERSHLSFLILAISVLSLFFLNLSRGLPIFFFWPFPRTTFRFVDFLFWFLVFNLFLNFCSDYYLFSSTLFLFTFPSSFLSSFSTFYSFPSSFLFPFSSFLFPSPASSFSFLKWKHILLILDLSSFDIDSQWYTCLSNHWFFCIPKFR